MQPTSPKQLFHPFHNSKVHQQIWLFKKITIPKVAIKESAQNPNISSAH